MKIILINTNCLNSENINYIKDKLHTNCMVHLIGNNYNVAKELSNLPVVKGLTIVKKVSLIEDYYDEIYDLTSML